MDYLLSCSFACVSIEYKSLSLGRMSGNTQTLLILYLKYNTAYCQQLYRANGATSLIHVLDDLVPFKFWTLCTISKKDLDCGKEIDMMYFPTKALYVFPHNNFILKLYKCEVLCPLFHCLTDCLSERVAVDGITFDLLAR